MEVLGLVSVDQRRRGGGFKARYRLGTVGRNEKRFGGYKGRRRVGNYGERRLVCDVTYNNESQSVIILGYACGVGNSIPPLNTETGDNLS